MYMLFTLHIDLSQFYGGLDRSFSGSAKDLDASITILNSQAKENRGFAMNVMFQDVAITQV